MSKTITYGEFEKFLVGLGFTRRRAPGSHVYFEHEPSGAAVVVKDYDPQEVVPSYKISGASGTLHHFGLLDRDDFDEALENSRTAAKAG